MEEELERWEDAQLLGAHGVVRLPAAGLQALQCPALARAGSPIPVPARRPPVGLHHEAAQLLGAFPFPSSRASAAWVAVSRSTDKGTCPWSKLPARPLFTSCLRYCAAGLAAIVMATAWGGAPSAWPLCPLSLLPSPLLPGLSTYLHRQDLSFQF